MSFRRNFLIYLAIALAAAASGTPTQAQQRFENLDRLDGIVATTVGATIGQPGGAVAAVDRRLRLAACPSLPEVSGPVFGAAMVACKELGWRIRVPLAASPASSPPAYSAASPARVPPRAVPAQSHEIIVKRGDPVELVAAGASFSVSRFVIADEDGYSGQLIRVREDRKADPIFAQVVEPGIVRAPGFKQF